MEFLSFGSLGLFGFLMFFGLYIIASSLDGIAEAQKATAEAIRQVAEKLESKS